MPTDVRTTEELPLRKRHKQTLVTIENRNGEVRTNEVSKILQELKADHKGVAATTTTTTPTSETKAPVPKKRKHDSIPNIHQPDERVEEEEDSNKTYCLCKRPYQKGMFMIACDNCDEWYHGKCVGVTQQESKRIKRYLCPPCREKRKKKKEEMAAPPPPKRCTYKGCGELAKANSKYCCDECGIKAAKDKLKEKHDQKQIEEKEKFENLKKQLTQEKTISIATSDDLKTLDELAKRLLTVQQEIRLLAEKEKKLDKAIEFSKTLFTLEVHPLPYDNSEDGKKTTGLETLDCATCGQPIPSKNWARHQAHCFVKVNKSSNNEAEVLCRVFDPKAGTYCQKPLISCTIHSSSKINQDLMCGCPTSDFPSGHCEKLRQLCTKHVNWEGLQKAHIAQEKIRLNGILKNLQSEEKLITSRISRRSALEGQADVTIIEHS